MGYYDYRPGRDPRQRSGPEMEEILVNQGSKLPLRLLPPPAHYIDHQLG